MPELPEQMRPLPTDTAYPGNELVGDCFCSRCLQPIHDGTVPIWMWTQNGEWAWRYHPSCVGIQDVEYEDEDDWDDYYEESKLDDGSELDWDDWMLEAAVEDENEDDCNDKPELDLGTCCACGGNENVRNIIALHQRAPVENSGWGCMVCSLPPNGASAIICDRCLETDAKIKEVIYGYPIEKQRMAIADLKYVQFQHDINKHFEEDVLN